MLPLAEKELVTYISSALEKNEAKEGLLGAVSGGPDSTVLLHALAMFHKVFPSIPVVVATVDHGLRPEAADEAYAVAEQAHNLGLSHHILCWKGPYPITGVQEAARNARYQLLADLAKQLGCSVVMTAHTLDDQAETLLMRLARGSGVAGLSGMRMFAWKEGVTLCRPFLGIAKTRLVATCESQNWKYFSDPTNMNAKYTRVRWRTIAPVLAQEGLTALRLGRFAERCARANDALDYYANDLYKKVYLPETMEHGMILDAVQLMAAPDEIGLRVLIMSVQNVTHIPFVRLERVETFYHALKEAVSAKGRLKRSLGSGVLELKKSGKLLIIKEPERFRGRCIFQKNNNL